MCLIAIAWQAHPDHPLIVAANRDEWRDRPAAAAAWWPEHPDLLAGRDLQAGGTWMGITRGGRFAAVTNFRDPAERQPAPRSRGALVTDYLLGETSPEAYLAAVAPAASEYNGFNLLLGDGRSLWYFGSREGEARAVQPGVHALSNHLLDEPWPKVTRARAALAAALADDDDPLFAMLSDDSPAPDTLLPETGVGIERERQLSSILIRGDTYGTRSSTVLRVGADGSARFEERTRGPSGEVASSSVFAFPLAR